MESKKNMSSSLTGGCSPFLKFGFKLDKLNEFGFHFKDHLSRRLSQEFVIMCIIGSG